MKLNKLVCGLLIGQSLLLGKNVVHAESTNVDLGVQVVYRLYNPVLQEHLYTTDENEYDVLNTRGWSQEGVAWYAPSQNATRVTRLYSLVTKKHLYTLDQNEVNRLLATKLWTKDGMSMLSGGDYSIYRLYQPGLKSHLLTADGNEYGVLKSRGWNQEGVKIKALALANSGYLSFDNQSTQTNQGASVVKNTITLSPEYVSAIQNMSVVGVNEYASLRDQIYSVSQNLKASNQYKENPSDSVEQVDVNNLSVSQLQELSLFAADLINQVRAQVGTKSVSVSKGSLSMVDSISDQYVSHNFVADGHDNVGINSVAKSFGLPFDQSNGSQYYENLNTYGMAVGTISMSEAKKYIYNSIVKGFLFNGAEYSHALSILGFSTGESEYFGVDVSSRGGSTSFHFVLVPYSSANSSSQFDKTVIVE